MIEKEYDDQTHGLRIIAIIIVKKASRPSLSTSWTHQKTKELKLKNASDWELPEA